MFKNNLYGKLSCIFGALAFTLCVLANHSKQYRLFDKENPLLSPIVNYLKAPIGHLNRLFFSSDLPKEHTLTAFDGHHVFEQEAMVMFFAIGLISAVIALALVIKAATKHEYSIWYALSGLASVVAMGLFSPYLGGLAVIVTIVLLQVPK